MHIASNTVVSFDYRLTDSDGELIDASEGQPLTYLHGHGQIVPGLESALEGKTVGDDVRAVVQPRDGYGERSGGEPLVVDRHKFPPGQDPAEGMSVRTRGANGEDVVFWVVGVQGDEIHLSPDHPLAGVTLSFDVTIREVRAATEDELAHGHAHAPGSQHHH